MTVVLAALLTGVCVGLLVWYFVSTRVESKIISERMQRFVGGVSKSGASKKGELLKAGFTTKKGTLRRFFDLSVVPSFKQWVVFFGIWLVGCLLILFKFHISVIFKFGLILIITFTLQRLLNLVAVRARLEELRKELPGALELVVICMEAGLSINASFLRVSNELRGSPLGKELRQTFNEIQAGATLEDALSNLAKRVELPEIYAVVSSIVQAQKMGTPISGTLRIQVETLNEKMRMRTREEIMRVPIKVLFPLVFFIFPVLFIIILGPALIDIIENLVGVSPS